MSRRYRDAAAKLQQSVQKHLRDMEELASSSDEEAADAGVLSGVVARYGGELHGRTRALLEESAGGRAPACLVCIASVRRAHAAWACTHCHCTFHLSCIQQWAADSVGPRPQAAAPVEVVLAPREEWYCPKCRCAYGRDEIPRKYLCYCGKVQDPPQHPWLLPHSCGEVCGRRLAAGCAHRCLLLCHPGPCPPCPQTVDAACHCAAERKRVRCSFKEWSCGRPCGKKLLCGVHMCEDVCHAGECAPCAHTSMQPCACGADEAQRPCSDPVWRCTKVCNKPFSCGYHKCEEVCHSGDCGDCPNSGPRTCPCGATRRLVRCPDVMEPCLGTCGREHADCGHPCPARCHRGSCPPCLVLVEKKCSCSAHVRSLPCSKEFRCETKCRGTRPCGKHACARKCCNGDCPPCEKLCDKPLQCGRHRCTNVCHRGRCYPCPLEARVTCRCKETYVTVPCGREKSVRPPRCSKPCRVKYKCGHNEENEHPCHFGDCPPCKAICGAPYEACEHACVATCHRFVSVVFAQAEKPATPWEVRPPETRVVKLPCPPCSVPVPVLCLGEHETERRACHEAVRRSCGRECGQPLPCGNHRCAAPCHLLAPDPRHPGASSDCAPCERACERPRPEGCAHACGLGVCHPGPCPPCDVPCRVPCHCGTVQLYRRCRELCAEPEALSCEQQCPRSLPCGHRCREPCHAGPCAALSCSRKTKLHCPCGNLKKEAPCDAVRAGRASLACDHTCQAKKRAAEEEREKERRRLHQLEEERARRELEEYEWKLSGKKKKYKEKKVVVDRDDRNCLQKYWLPILSVFIVLLAAVYYIFCL